MELPFAHQPNTLPTDHRHTKPNKAPITPRPNCQALTEHNSIPLQRLSTSEFTLLFQRKIQNVPNQTLNGCFWPFKFWTYHTVHKSLLHTHYHYTKLLCETLSHFIIPHTTDKKGSQNSRMLHRMQSHCHMGTSMWLSLTRQQHWKEELCKTSSVAHTLAETSWRREVGY